jgi:hypothetical protein
MKFNKIIAVGLVVVGFGRWCYGGGQASTAEALLQAGA